MMKKILLKTAAISLPLIFISAFVMNFFERFSAGKSYRTGPMDIFVFIGMGASIWFWLTFSAKDKSEDVHAVLEKLNSEDKKWNKKDLLFMITDTFIMKHHAMSDRNYARLQFMSTDGLYQKWEKKLSHDKKRGQHYTISSVEVTEVLFIDLCNFTEDQKDSFTVLISGVTKGRVFVNNENMQDDWSVSDKPSEVWTFLWESDRWVIARIDPYDLMMKFVNREIINEARKITSLKKQTDSYKKSA